MNGDFIAKFFAREANKAFGAARAGIHIAIHPAAYAVLHRFCARFLDETLEVIDFLLRCRVASSAGDVKGDLIAEDSAEQFAHGFARDASEHIEHGKLDQRDRTPEQQSLQFVIVTVAIHAPQMIFEVARVFPDEIGNHEFVQHRREDIGTAIVDRESFCAIGRANAEEITAPFLQQLHRLDFYRRAEETLFEDRPRRFGLQRVARDRRAVRGNRRAEQRSTTSHDG